MPLQPGAKLGTYEILAPKSLRTAAPARRRVPNKISSK